MDQCNADSGDASFGKLAERHSICPTAGRGGEIGWISPGTGLPAQLEEAIFEADINEPFTADSPGGVHLLQVMEERQAWCCSICKPVPAFDD